MAPFITSYDGLRNENCWGFWFEQHIHQGGGEVADLHRIAQQVEANFVIDANRRFITGLSSGGAMALVAAVAYNEYWAAAAPAAGLPYRETASSVSLSGQCPGSATFRSVSQVAADMRSEVNDAYPIPLMILQNRNDCTVLQTAANNMRDAHLQVFGSTSRNTPATVSYTHLDVYKRQPIPSRTARPAPNTPWRLRSMCVKPVPAARPSSIRPSRACSSSARRPWPAAS